VLALAGLVLCDREYQQFRRVLIPPAAARQADPPAPRTPLTS
jgi:hypothetical protein